jgi:hypothetical protein
MKEKRAHPRITVTLPIECWETLDGSRGGLVRNVSEAGLLIHSIYGMDVGSELTIKVSFSMGYNFDSFVALARIVWKDVHTETAWEGYKYGLEFIQLSQENRQKLTELLTSQQEQRFCAEEYTKALRRWVEGIWSRNQGHESTY